MEFTKGQKRIFNSKIKSHCVIKGISKVGKTTACIKKMAYLFENTINTNNHFLIVVNNQNELNKSLDIYKKMHSGKYHQNSFFDKENTNTIDIKTIDDLADEYFNEYIEINNTEANSPYNSTLNDISQKCLNLKHIKKVDYRDKYEIMLKELKKYSYKKYSHILVDDSQCLTKTQLEFIKSLYYENENSKITFIFNSDKVISGSVINKSSRVLSDLGYNMKGKTIILKKEDSFGEKGYNIKRKKNRKKKLDVYKSLIPEDLITLSLRNNETIFSNKKESNNIVGKDDSMKNDKSFSLEKIQYIDLKRNVSHLFIKDTTDSREIYIEDSNVEEKAEEIVEIPVFNEIAAGSPILMNESIEFNYYLPKEWVRKSKDTFMLRIKGDSMVNKNINHGDYVLISKQNTANIGEIVAVDIDGEATLKTLKKKYGKIALTPENDAYDPIIIENQQFYILGVAIGLIKEQI